MNKFNECLVIVFLLALYACAAIVIGVRTPSGKPELAVRLSDKEIESRLTQSYTATGWSFESSDDLGFSLSKSYSGEATAMVGKGGMRVRFNLWKAKGYEEVTQIRAICALVVDGVETDESSSNLGREVQKSLEELFAAEAVDGPFMME